MVSCEDEHVLVVTDPEQHSSQKQARRKIKLPLCFCVNSIPHLSVALSFCERTQVGYRHFESRHGHCDLNGPACHNTDLRP